MQNNRNFAILKILIKIIIYKQGLSTVSSRVWNDLNFDTAIRQGFLLHEYDTIIFIEYGTKTAQNCKKFCYKIFYNISIK